MGRWLVVWALVGTAGTARADMISDEVPDEACPPGAEWSHGHGGPYCVAGDAFTDVAPTGGECAWYASLVRASVCEVSEEEWGRYGRVRVTGACADGCSPGVCREVEYCRRGAIGRGMERAHDLTYRLAAYPLAAWPFLAVATVGAIVRATRRATRTAGGAWEGASWIALVAGTLALALFAWDDLRGHELAIFVLAIVASAVPIAPVLRLVAAIHDRRSGVAAARPGRRIAAWLVIWLPVVAGTALAARYEPGWAAAAQIQLGATISVAAMCAASLGRWAGGVADRLSRESR